MRETEDQLIREMLAGTAAVLNCVHGANGDTPTELHPSDIGAVVQTLLGNDAKTISQSIEGADKIGTSPIRNSYFALAHSDISYDLTNVDGFTYTANYPSQRGILASEWGSVQNLRFFLSSVGSISSHSSLLDRDVYNIFCVGMEAYTVVEQDGLSAQFIYRPPIYDSPLALNCSAGWKMSFASRITNDLWALNLRATRTI